jgi:hypothetical protein
VAARTAKPKATAVWQISRVAKKAQVEAADADAAIRAASKKFDIDPEHQDRLGGAPDRDG